jgi:hypothetical protein
MVCLIKNGSVADILASFVPIPIPEYVQWMIYRATLQYQFAEHITSTHNKNMKNNSKCKVVVARKNRIDPLLVTATK